MEEIIQKLQEHDKKFIEHDKRFDQIDGQIDFIVKKVSEHDERLERIETNMVTKADIGKITDTLDKLVGFAEKTNQAVTLLAHGLRIAEDKAEEHDIDIRKMKPILGLS